MHISISHNFSFICHISRYIVWEMIMCSVLKLIVYYVLYVISTTCVAIYCLQGVYVNRYYIPHLIIKIIIFVISAPPGRKLRWVIHQFVLRWRLPKKHKIQHGFKIQQLNKTMKDLTLLLWTEIKSKDTVAKI